METEKVEFNLANELKAAFPANKDEETTEALLALQSIEQTLAVNQGFLHSRNLVIILEMRLH